MLKGFRFDLFYISFLKVVNKSSNIIYTLIKTILTTFAIPVSLIFVLAVEVPRVEAGIATFDKTTAHALQAAIILVLTQMVLEELIFAIEEKYEWKNKNEYSFTLQTLFERFKYFVGYTTEKEKYRKSPAFYYKTAARINAVTILVLSIVGSLQERIQAVSGQNEAWHLALKSIFLDSNLETFTSVLGGVVMAFALLAISTRFSRYVAVKASETMSEIENNSKRIIQEQFDERFTAIKNYIKTLRSRTLNSLDLGVFNDEDRIETLDNGLIVFYNSANGDISKPFDLSKANHRTKFYELLVKEINEREKKNE